MSKTFQAPATLTTFHPTSDGGLRLGFTTEVELTPEEKLIALRFHRSRGWLLFKESEFQDTEIPDSDPVEEGQKTPSRRLRDVLFVLFKQTAGHTDMLFQDFYSRELEKIIEQKKRLLNDD